MRHLKFCLIIVVFILLLSGIFGVHIYNKYFNYNKIAIYHLYADKLDINVVNSYPQKIIKILSISPYYELIISVEPRIKKIGSAILYNHNYDKEIAEYLENTIMIQSHDSIIGKLADEIIGQEKDVVKIAKKTAKWTSKNIKYDSELAQKISMGIVHSESAIETLVRKKGTCIEYTNVFIAVMRYKGIPTKFVIGYVFGGIYHSWAEFYVEGVGWISADPQEGIINLDNRYIKLFEGRDFPSTNILLREIKMGVEKEY